MESLHAAMALLWRGAAGWNVQPLWQEERAQRPTGFVREKDAGGHKEHRLVSTLCVIQIIHYFFSIFYEATKEHFRRGSLASLPCVPFPRRDMGSLHAAVASLWRGFVE